MELEKHVTSLELSKRLCELGVKQESLFYWFSFNLPFDVRYRNETPMVNKSKKYSAFTASELLELLPYNYNLTRFDGKDSYEKNDFYSCYDEDLGFGNETQFSEKSADACAKMLIHLIEQKIWVPE